MAMCESISAKLNFYQHHLNVISITRMAIGQSINAKLKLLAPIFVFKQWNPLSASQKRYQSQIKSFSILNYPEVKVAPEEHTSLPEVVLRLAHLNGVIGLGCMAKTIPPRCYDMHKQLTWSVLQWLQ